MKSAIDNTCIHCGADCGKSPIIWNEMNFCCNGCLTVYQLLNENKLYKYYQLEDSPGIKVETTEFGNKYAFLENTEVKEKLISFTEGNISKVNFFIPGYSLCILYLAARKPFETESWNQVFVCKFHQKRGRYYIRRIGNFPPATG